MLPTIGSRERVELVGLGLPTLTARIDTGARTSALHVTSLHVDGDQVVFTALDDELRPTQCSTRLEEWRWVRDSGGHATIRPVIRCRFRLGAHEWEDEVTLGDREGLRHRLLVGRRSLHGRFVVDVARGFLHGPPPPRRDEAPTDPLRDL